MKDKNKKWKKIASKLNIIKESENLLSIKYKKSTIKIQCKNGNCEDLQVILNNDDPSAANFINDDNWSKIKKIVHPIPKIIPTTTSIPTEMPNTQPPSTNTTPPSTNTTPPPS